MLFRIKSSQPPLVRPRVTPDPEHAAQLERRFSELNYYPECGFLRDRCQDRLPPPRLRLAP